MMNTRLSKALVALLAVAAVGACEDPPIEPGNNDAARLFTTASVVVVEAGESREVQAYLVNDQGNPVTGDVEFSACSGLITVVEDEDQSEIEPGTNFVITGNTLGQSCVNVSAGGFEETITVRVVPGGLQLNLADTLLSGATVPASVVFQNATGGPVTGFDLDEVTFVSLDEDIGVVDAQGNVTAQAPGTGQLAVILNAGLGAPRADTVSFVVIPGTFSGTVTPDEGPGGTLTTFEMPAGGPEVDETTFATITFGFDTYPLYPIAGTDANTYVSRLPYGVDPGSGVVTITGLGEGEVALSTVVELTAKTANDPHEPNQLFVSAVDITLPYNNILFQDGSDTEDRFRFVLTDSTTLRFVLDWDDVNGSHDLDFILYTPSGAGGVSAGCNAATAAHPETTTCTLAPNTYLVRIDNYDADHGGAQGPTNYHLQIFEPEP